MSQACGDILVEASRGHKDARHEEPIVLRNRGRQGDVGFMPPTRAFSIDVSGLAKSVDGLPVYDADGKKMMTLAVSAEGKARHDFDADKSRKEKLWRLHLNDARAVINIDGVTRWQRGEAWENISFLRLLVDVLVLSQRSPREPPVPLDVAGRG